METLKLSHRFFHTELKNYSNFGFAFFRELIQNSVDAKASQIHISIENDGANQKVTFKDNGVGMSEEILRNVYFSLGSTTKDTNETIGGFGKARILTCFAHPYYSIRTQNLFCKGEGSQFEIDNNQEFMKGCEVQVVIENKSSLLDSLNSYLSHCQLDCQVYVNGVRHTDWMYRRQIARSLTFGNIHVNKSVNSMYAHIRVNGVLMYSRYIKSNCQLILEITSEKSREVLLSNRDSLNYEYQKELDAFINEFAVNKTSALKNKGKNYIKKFGNTYRNFKNKGNVTFIPSKQETVKESNLVITNLMRTSNDNAINLNQKLESLGNATVLEVMQENMLIVCQSEIPEICKAALAFEPNNWVDGGGKKKKLLHLWTAMTGFVIDKYLAMKNKESVLWGVGFAFDEDSLGKCLHKDEVNYILLNPVDDDGGIRYSITDRDSWIKMITIAVHEVVHVECELHDEDFASDITLLMAKVFCGLSELVKILKGI